MNINSKGKISTTLFAASLFSLTLFWLGPTFLYFTNILEFNFFYKDVWYFFLAASMFSIFLLTAVLFPLKASIHKVAVSLLFSLGVLLWLQGNILVWNYGVLDGKEFHLGNYKIQAVIDIVIWLLIVLVAIKLRTYIYKLIPKVSVGLILIQIISICLVWYQSPPEPEWKKNVASEDSKYIFSTEKNVIILVLDTFQTDVFQELLNEEPKNRDNFNGFTYFRNSLGGFPTTYPSIPLILTGLYYDNSVPIQDFIDKHSASSLPSKLKQNGFSVDLQTERAFYHFFEDVSKDKGLSNLKNELLKTYSATLFRYSPHVIKNYFYQPPIDFIQGDLDFAENIITKSKTTSDKPSFKFFHLRGAHPPFLLGEQLQRQELPFNRNSYKTQSKASIEIAKRFLTTLKKLGIYENSMILIVGDHGLGSFGVNIETSGFNKTLGGETTSNKIIASAIPLILVKPFGSSGPMEISDAPVCLSDIPKTVFSELGMKNDYPGRSMFSVKSSESRERKFYKYNWEDKDWEKDYLPPMYEYSINGFSWLNQSWRPTYRTFTSSGIKDNHPPFYNYGSQIQSGVEGKAGPYLVSGWNQPERDFTWTDGRSATIVLPVREPESDLTLDMVLTPFLSSRLSSQKVNVYINHHKVGEWLVKAHGEYRITVPKKYIKEPLLVVGLELPDATSPVDLGISNDQRTLGVALQTLKISEISVYHFGSKVLFGDAGNAEQYQISGWSKAEKGGTWTEGESSSFALPVNPPEKDLVLNAVITPFITSNLKKQRVDIRVNGQKLGQWVVKSAGKYQIIIPQHLIKESPLEIDFGLPDAASPSELGVSNDPRSLAITVKSITITELK